MPLERPPIRSHLTPKRVRMGRPPLRGVSFVSSLPRPNPRALPAAGFLLPTRAPARARAGAGDPHRMGRDSPSRRRHGVTVSRCHGVTRINMHRPGWKGADPDRGRWINADILC